MCFFSIPFFLFAFLLLLSYFLQIVLDLHSLWINEKTRTRWLRRILSKYASSPNNLKSIPRNISEKYEQNTGASCPWHANESLKVSLFLFISAMVNISMLFVGFSRIIACCMPWHWYGWPLPYYSLSKVVVVVFCVLNDISFLSSWIWWCFLSCLAILSSIDQYFIVSVNCESTCDVLQAFRRKQTTHAPWHSSARLRSTVIRQISYVVGWPFLPDCHNSSTNPII